MYTAIPYSYYTGVYRMLNSKHFAKEIGLGFGLDIAFTLALLFLQGLNNSAINGETVDVYKVAGPF